MCDGAGRDDRRRDASPPAPNEPAAVEWDAGGGRLALRYDGELIMEAVVRVAEGDGSPAGRHAIECEQTSERLGERVTQCVRLFCREPHEDATLLLSGKVSGSAEAFPAELSGGRSQEVFPCVRTCSGLSRNLRNNAVYDRYSDWVLSAPEGTCILPGRTETGTEFRMSCEGKGLRLVFKPGFYRRHKNLPYFDPRAYRVRKESIAGYCTWWAYREEGIDQDKLDAVLEVWKKKNLVDYGYEYFQIDGGWASGGGSPEGYLNWNDRFPGGAEYAIRGIREAGMKPGLHTAIVFREGDEVVDKAVEEHPDWFMPNAEGQLCDDGTYTLNPFSEEALERLVRPTYRGLKKQGWEYAKLDGEGDLLRRSYRRCAGHIRELGGTPGEALRRLNRAARDELGDDTFVLGCWGVMPDLAGIIDGCRLGRDAFGPAELQYFNSWNGVVWRNDPDHCDIRPPWLTVELPWFMECVGEEPDTPPADSIVRPCVVSLAGGILLLSDKAEVYENDLNLEGARRSAPVIFTVPGQLYDFNATESDRVKNDTEDNLERAPERRIHLRHPHSLHAPQRGNEAVWWLLEMDRPFDNWSVLARFNWRKLSLHWDRENRAAEEVRFIELGLPDDKEYLVYEFWGRQFLGRMKHSFTAPRQASDNGLQVFSIREAREHPWVVSTSRHISQGGVDLLDLRWDAAALALLGDSAVVRDDPYVITVYVPAGYELLDVDSPLVEAVARERDHVAISLAPSRTAPTSWQITFSGPAEGVRGAIADIQDQ